jgi:hypothetical protein
VQLQPPTTDWQAEIDAIEDYDETPPSTLTTWVLGLLFALMISWLPAAIDTTHTPTGIIPVIEHHHLAPTPGISTCIAPGQEVNPPTQSGRGNGRTKVSEMPTYLPIETSSP